MTTDSRDRWIGTRVGLYLTVVARAGRDISDKQRFRVRCDCGAERIIMADMISRTLRGKAKIGFTHRACVSPAKEAEARP